MGQTHSNFLNAYTHTKQSGFLTAIGVLSMFNQGFHATKARCVLSGDEGLVAENNRRDIL
jgi:hypothetical protein